MVDGRSPVPDQVLARLAALRRHGHGGHRSPHKPLLVLLALGRLMDTGSSALRWSQTWDRLSDLIAEFGPASKTGAAQRAAYPFTRLRSDGVWQLDHDVDMDLVKPLRELDVVGRFEPGLEAALARDPGLVLAAARALAESHFPPTVAPDVLAAAGFDPEVVLRTGDELPDPPGVMRRRRDPGWRAAVIEAWDRKCAFCGYDGQVRGATVGLDAAHVRWFAYDGPDSLDNGLALCALHHKLFDRGVLGLDRSLRIDVSQRYSTRTRAGETVYGLHRQLIVARPGTPMPAAEHVDWHRREVFLGEPLAA